jgi:hypothetical protein
MGCDVASVVIHTIAGEQVQGLHFGEPWLWKINTSPRFKRVD